MAKTTKAESPRSNRVRFMMLDADLSDGNLSELTQAIATAMGRSAQNTCIQALPPATGIDTAGITNGNGNGHVEAAVVNHEPVETSEEEEETTSATSATARTPKKLPLPKYVTDLFSKEQGEQFKAAYGSVSKQSVRFLVCAYWLKEKLGKTSINIHDVYTCYKTAGWPTNINDWDANLREHAGRSNKLHRVAPGEYTITPVGESAVPAPATAGN